MLDLARGASRQGEIIEIVLNNGWGYMQRLLSGSKTDEPELPPPAVLRNILTDLGPVYIKLGQLLSTRPDLLPPSYIVALSSLQSTVPAVGATEIEAFMRQHLPHPPEEVFSQIKYDAIAAGSIGQTHKATLKDGREVALKVQRPGIEVVVTQDVALIKNVARLMTTTAFGQRYDVVGLAEEFGTALQAELDFTQEAHFTDTLRQNLAESRWYNPKQLVVPEVIWELTTSKILVLEWLNGKPILEAQLRSQREGTDPTAERKALTTLAFRAFFQQFLLDGFFHADPHPGNLFYLNDGRLALLDCGMVGRLDPQTRTALTELILAIVSTDAQRCTQLSLQIAEPTQPVDLIQLENDMKRLLRRYNNLNLANLNTAQAFNELLQTASANHLRWPGSIGLYTKALANLEGVARQFNPELNVVAEVQPLMGDLFWQQLVGEDPLQAVLRTALEFRSLSLESPRQFSFLLNRLSTETLKWKATIPELEGLRRSIDDAANRRSFSTLVGSLVIGAAIVSTGQQTPQVQLVSNILFAVASLTGLWLIVSILRSGQLR